VYSVGAIDWDRRLFDSLIPLPLGTSYNAYLIQGESKVALVDTVEPGLAKHLFDNLDELGVTKIDYVVCHHAEQDHSGSIPAVLERYPGAKVVTNQKCMDLLSSHLRVPSSSCEIIADGAVLDLGGRSLQFIFAPWLALRPRHAVRRRRTPRLSIGQALLRRDHDALPREVPELPAKD
jgi:flavorubredoxin